MQLSINQKEVMVLAPSYIEMGAIEVRDLYCPHCSWVEIYWIFHKDDSLFANCKNCDKGFVYVWEQELLYDIQPIGINKYQSYKNCFPKVIELK